MGYHQSSGGGWSKGILVADWDHIENAEQVSDIHVKIVHHEEIELKLKQGKFVFPRAEGTLRQPGSNRYRNSSSRSHAKGDPSSDDDAEERVDTDEEEVEDEDRKGPAEAQPEETEPADAPKDYWSFPGETVHIHHVQPRTT